MKTILFTSMAVILLAGCTPKVGSEDWCANLREKRTDDWTLKETQDYATNCIIKIGGKHDT